MADVGTDAFEQEFTLSLMEHDGGRWSRSKLLLSASKTATMVMRRVRGQDSQGPPAGLPHTPYCVKSAIKVVSR